uniref:Ig-like domain-containing protein n=1 Tax=Mola mola TaxID=94237 RepID=A0A3Q4AU27_MOLML
RVVTVSPGPLIRVEGQPVSIRCDVNEYGGPREQDFEWMMSRDSNGQRIMIISTFDSSYSHPSLSKRVASGDISVMRLQDNEVELKIAEVKALDAGFYWCQTPSTDSVISGNYEARVQLTVIPNTLKVSPQTPPPVVPEGSDITLSCNVTRELTHPTYLSITWLVKKGATSEEILAFGPQGDVTTGPKYARRYADGGIRLVPGKNGLFELVISKVMSSDEGIYECNGTEWTHESGGKWIKIVQSTKKMGTVSVTPTGQSLSVKASSSSSSSALLLSPGNTLTLLCSVTADNLPALALEVTWLADGRDIVTMDRSGVVISNTSTSGVQGKRGEASLERTGAGDYRLQVRTMSGEDGGAYVCRVRAFIEKGGRSAGGGGRWHMAAEKTSNPVTVKVSQIMKMNVATLIACSLSLCLQEVDMGLYVCTVSAWSVNSQGDMVKIAEQQSSPQTIRWVTKRPSLNVIARHIREASVGGATFEMSCTVATDNLGEVSYSVLIQSQESLDSNVRTIMTLDPDNVVQHGGVTDPNRRDSLVLTKSGQAEFRFRLAGVQLSDRGYYWCDVTAWTKQQPGKTWTRATSAESNKVKIDFQENGPSFSIAIHSDVSTVYPWETAKMECKLSVSGSSPKTDDLAYEVHWFFTRLRGGETTTQVASIDRFGVMRKEARNSSSDISIERKDTHTYTMNIHGTHDSDSGEYHCMATPWYLSASTGAWTEAGELMSSRIFLTVRFAGEECVGLFSLVLGLVCAQCCCRNTAHTPRSRNKLMDLEMD